MSFYCSALYTIYENLYKFCKRYELIHTLYNQTLIYSHPRKHSCTYVCMYIYVYIYVYMYTYICMYVCILLYKKIVQQSNERTRAYTCHLSLSLIQFVFRI